MGFFDNYKDSPDHKLNAQLAFVVSILYMISIDAEIDSEEIAVLLSIVGGIKDYEHGALGVRAKKPSVLDRALEYRSKNSVDNFLKESAPLLTESQKISILINLLDCALIDGDFEPHEHDLFVKFQKAFAISDQRVQSCFETIKLKNDRAIFAGKD